MTSADAARLSRAPMHDHHRPSRPGEVDLGPVDPSLPMQATVVLRSPSVSGSLAADVEQVARFAAQHRLAVAEIGSGNRSVTLTGCAEDFESAFAVKLVDVERAGRRYRRYHGIPSLPPQLREVAAGAFGLRSRPTRPRARIHHAGSTSPFWTTAEMATAYEFPEIEEGTGQRIALIELGGGYSETDLQQFFHKLGRDVPRISFKSIDGALNQPASPDAIQAWLDVLEGRREESSVDSSVLEAAQTTVEVTMDIELAGALAPGAELVVYMAPATEEGIYKALSMAAHDEDPRIDVISMSWGEPEPYVSDAHMTAINQVLEYAVQRGITVCASSGDFGAYDDPETKTLSVNFPASSPLVLACGGSTVLRTTSEIEKEIAWNCGPHGMHAASGGGVSERFTLPDWQRSWEIPLSPGGKPGRGVPDVAGAADPHNGCAIIVGGKTCCSFGTSAVAPLWAALVARCNQALGTRCGLVNDALYQIARSEQSAFRTVTEGDNGFYKAADGWNPCTGLGTPRGRRLLELLRDSRRTAQPPLAA